MKRIAGSFALALLLAACSSSAPPPPAEAPKAAEAPVAADTQFDKLAERWLDSAMRFAPVNATQIGDHRFDAELDDLSPEALSRAADFSRNLLGELGKIDRRLLSRDKQVDAALLENQLKYDVWTHDKLKPQTWDPLVYTQIAGGALYNVMAREYAPLPQRMTAAISRMEKLPKLFEQMRANLDLARVPKIHAETVAKQNKGVLSLVDELIAPHVNELDDAGRKRLEDATAALKKAVDEHQKWIDGTLVPNAKGDFRIGKELYDAKLAFALNSTLGREEIRRRAELEIARVRGEMYEIARGVLKGKKKAPPVPDSPSDTQQQAAIAAALELAYADRPARDQVMATATDALAKSTAFVKEKDLVTLPDAPVEIVPMPEFQRGVAVAYCDSPGPLDKGQKTFYAVSPIPDDWTAAQVDSFLREYNTRSIHELTVHEAMPGHFVQIWHSNKYPSAVRAVLASGSFVEGWAVYVERVMADVGYYDNDPLYKLINDKWYLRAVANAILDQGIHVDGMTKEQAMELMTVKTFQEEREAAGKWVRAQLSSAQLPTYFVGAQEHFDLRKETEKRWGATFNLKRYHDALLAFGSPPGRYARELLLDEPID